MAEEAEMEDDDACTGEDFLSIEVLLVIFSKKYQVFLKAEFLLCDLLIQFV